jgi:glucan biosynthesis protein
MGQHAYPLRVPKGLSPDTGFAGFRLWYPVLKDGVYEEFVAFLGASYFRAKARASLLIRCAASAREGVRARSTDRARSP